MKTKSNHWLAAQLSRSREPYSRLLIAFRAFILRSHPDGNGEGEACERGGVRKHKALNRAVHERLTRIAIACAFSGLAACAHESRYSPGDQVNAAGQVTAGAPHMQASDLLDRLQRLAIGLEVSQFAASKFLGLALPNEDQAEYGEGGPIRSAKYSSGGSEGKPSIKLRLNQERICIASEQVLDRFGVRFVAMPAIHHPYPDTRRMSERVKQNRSLFLEGPLYVFGDHTLDKRLRIGFAFDFSECLQSVYIDTGAN